MSVSQCRLAVLPQENLFTLFLTRQLHIRLAVMIKKKEVFFSFILYVTDSIFCWYLKTVSSILMNAVIFHWHKNIAVGSFWEIQGKSSWQHTANCIAVWFTVQWMCSEYFIQPLLYSYTRKAHLKEGENTILLFLAIIILRDGRSLKHHPLLLLLLFPTWHTAVEENPSARGSEHTGISCLSKPHG